MENTTELQRKDYYLMRNRNFSGKSGMFGRINIENRGKLSKHLEKFGKKLKIHDKIRKHSLTQIFKALMYACYEIRETSRFEYLGDWLS